MNILIVDRDLIYPPTNGKEIRVAQVVEWLTNRHEVWLACRWSSTGEEPSSINVVPLETPLLNRKITLTQAWFLSYLFDSNPKYDRFLAQRIVADVGIKDDLDAVLSASPQTITATRRIANQHDALMIVDKHNSYYTILKQYINNYAFSKTICRRAVSNLRAFEQHAINEANAVVFHSKDDRDLFNVPTRVTSCVIPNGCDYQKIAEATEHAEPKRRLGIETDYPVCVFIGSYDYKMNQLAAERIADEIAPEMPDIQFLLLGRNPPPLRGDNVTTPGFVQDLGGALKLADIGFCPLEFGSGTKLKMLDYCAAGLPIVTSSIGAQGLPIEDGKNALVRESSSKMCDAIRQLVESPKLRDHLGKEAKRLGRKYDWENLLKGYDEIISLE